MDLEDSHGCSKDSLNIQDIGGRSSVNTDQAGALILSSVSDNLLDSYWRSVTTYLSTTFFGLKEALIRIILITVFTLYPQLHKLYSGFILYPQLHKLYSGFILVSLQKLRHQKVSYCGSSIPHEFVSVGNTLKIRFRSDSTVSRWESSLLNADLLIPDCLYQVRLPTWVQHCQLWPGLWHWPWSDPVPSLALLSPLQHPLLLQHHRALHPHHLRLLQILQPGLLHQLWRQLSRGQRWRHRHSSTPSKGS